MPDVALITMDKELEADGFALASQLRRAGLSVDMPYSGNVTKKMKRADKQGAAFVILLGSDEWASGTVQLKELATGQTDVIAVDQLIARLSH